MEPENLNIQIEEIFTAVFQKQLSTEHGIHIDSAHSIQKQIHGKSVRDLHQRRLNCSQRG